MSFFHKSCLDLLTYDSFNIYIYISSYTFSHIYTYIYAYMSSISLFCFCWCFKNLSYCRTEALKDFRMDFRCAKTHLPTKELRPRYDTSQPIFWAFLFGGLKQISIYMYIYHSINPLPHFKNLGKSYSCQNELYNMNHLSRYKRHQQSEVNFGIRYRI